MDYIKNCAWLYNTPIAHRGLHDDKLPENSIPAFQAAIDNGFSIEIDVHLSKDNQLVVFHDDNLKRVCGVNKLVRDCTVAELKTFSLCGTEYTIPTFDEFLELVDGKVGILCEIKGVIPWDTSIAKATVERCKTYDGNIALQSFNFGAVIYCRKHGDRPYGQLCTWGGVKINHLADFMGKLWISRISDPLFIAYDVRNAKRAEKHLQKAKRYGRNLIFWTAKTPEELAYTKEVADNVIFELPCGILNDNNK